jgi:hypothetical protein
MYSRTIITVDAIDLINLTLDRIENRGRDSKSDWAQIERVLRRYIQNGTLKKIDLEKAILGDPTFQTENSEPRLETLRKLIKSLHVEFGIAK